MGLFAKESSKGNGPREASKVDEDGGGEYLSIEPVLEVGEVMWVAPLDVIPNPSKWYSGSVERIIQLTMFAKKTSFYQASRHSTEEPSDKIKDCFPKILQQ